MYCHPVTKKGSLFSVCITEKKRQLQIEHYLMVHKTVPIGTLVGALWYPLFLVCARHWSILDHELFCAKTVPLSWWGTKTVPLGVPNYGEVKSIKSAPRDTLSVPFFSGGVQVQFPDWILDTSSRPQ